MKRVILFVLFFGFTLNAQEKRILTPEDDVRNGSEIAEQRFAHFDAGI